MRSGSVGRALRERGACAPGAWGVTTTTAADEFETHRPRLFGLACRLLGSAADAEDAVQDTYLRFSGADRTVIEQPGA